MSSVCAATQLRHSENPIFTTRTPLKMSEFYFEIEYEWEHSKFS